MALGQHLLAFLITNSTGISLCCSCALTRRAFHTIHACIHHDTRADLKEREAQAAIESHASFVLDRLNSGAATVYANQQRIEAEAAQVKAPYCHRLPSREGSIIAPSNNKSLLHIFSAPHTSH